jgi:hypothetical protein
MKMVHGSGPAGGRTDWCRMRVPTPFRDGRRSRACCPPRSWTGAKPCAATRSSAGRAPSPAPCRAWLRAPLRTLPRDPTIRPTAYGSLRWTSRPASASSPSLRPLQLNSSRICVPSGWGRSRPARELRPRAARCCCSRSLRSVELACGTCLRCCRRRCADAHQARVGPGRRRRGTRGTSGIDRGWVERVAARQGSQETRRREGPRRLPLLVQHCGPHEASFKLRVSLQTQKPTSRLCAFLFMLPRRPPPDCCLNNRSLSCTLSP